MTQFEYPKKSKFIVDIIQALHIQLDEFMYKVVHHSPYETILYIWIHKLYIKRKSCEDAVQLIYKARNMYLLTSCSKA